MSLKKYIFIVVLIFISILIIISFLSFKSFFSYKKRQSWVTYIEQKVKPIEIVIPVRYKFSVNDAEIIKENVLVTCYTNRREETDDTPNVTATGRFIFDGCCAVSQDMFRKVVFPGDIIYVVALDRFFIVEDTTNPRHTKLVDIFCFKDEKRLLDRAVRSDIYIFRFRK